MKMSSFIPLFSLFMLTNALLGGEIVAFPSAFPDPQLRGRKFDMPTNDAQESIRLGGLIVDKQREADDHLRSCEPNSKNWRKEAEKWNQLRAECYAMITQLRAIVSKYSDYIPPAYTPPIIPGPTTQPTAPTSPPIDLIPWRKLQVGMSKDQVRAILGEPTSIRVYSTLSVWSYESKVAWTGRVNFDNKGVSGWVEPQRY